MKNYKESIVELNESNKDMILDFISENVLHYYGEVQSVRTPEIMEVSKQMLIKQYEDGINQNSLKIFACIIENTVLGTIAMKNDKDAQLLFVKKEFQKMGIGTALVNYVQDMYDSINILAVADAVPFFEQNGFFTTEEELGFTVNMKYLRKIKDQIIHAIRK